MMKHSDQTRANPSFINVTAEAVVERAPLSLCCPGRERNASQHSLTCHAATPSILRRVERERVQLIRADEATQTPQLGSSAAEQDINTAVVRGLCSARVAQWVELNIGHLGPNRQRINLQSGGDKDCTMLPTDSFHSCQLFPQHG